MLKPQRGMRAAPATDFQMPPRGPRVARSIPGSAVDTPSTRRQAETAISRTEANEYGGLYEYAQVDGALAEGMARGAKSTLLIRRIAKR